MSKRIAEPISISFLPPDKKLIAELERATGMGRSAVVRQALAALARERGLALVETVELAEPRKAA